MVEEDRKQDMSGNETIAKETKRLVEIGDALLKGEEAGRRGDLEPYLHQDFNIIRANGIRQEREEFLSKVEENADMGRSAEPSEIRLYGDCAVVMTRVTTLRKPDGTVITRYFWMTRVFVRENDDWRCIAWQVTQIP
jgi:hypothetical protein